MSSLYTPVFPSSHLTQPPSALSSSDPPKRYDSPALDSSLSHLPPTLCPPSSSYVSSKHIDNIISAIDNALETCDCDRSRGKWGLVKGNLHLWCSGRGGGRLLGTLPMFRGSVVQSTPSPETEAQHPPAQLLITQSPMTITTHAKTWQQNLPFHTCALLIASTVTICSRAHAISTYQLKRTVGRGEEEEEDSCLGR